MMKKKRSLVQIYVSRSRSTWLWYTLLESLRQVGHNITMLEVSANTVQPGKTQ
jgi:hypothetical protein